MDSLFVKPEFTNHEGIPVLEKFGFTLEEEKECEQAIEQYRNQVAKKQQIEVENDKLEVELNQLKNLNTMITKLKQSYQTKLADALNGEHEQTEMNQDKSEKHSTSSANTVSQK